MKKYRTQIVFSVGYVPMSIFMYFNLNISDTMEYVFYNSLVYVFFLLVYNFRKEINKHMERKNILLDILLISALWLFATNLTQALKCPKMTKTELLLKIPSAFILDFEECKDLPQLK